MTLQEKIDSAELALQRLMTGSLREEVRYEGGMVRYTPADAEKLRGYIADLKREQIGSPARGAIGVSF